MNQRRTILVCYPQVPFVRGGTELLVDCLVKQIRERGHDVEAVSIPFAWQPRGSLVRNCMSWRLLDLERFEGKIVDRVIATKFPSYLISHPQKITYLFHQFRQVYDTFGTPYSDFTDSADDRRIRELIIGMDDRCLPESKAIYTISRNVGERLKKNNNLDSERLPPPPPLTGRFRKGEYGDYVLYVGRLNRSKRVDMLIRAMAHVDSKIRCCIVGTGEELMELQQLADRLNVAERIHFAGFVDDNELVEYYANCFGVFYAPHDEDYGFSTVEAFLSGKAVFTTVDAGGPLEFVTDGITGCVCEPDPEALAGRIENLFHNSKFCRSLGEAGHEKVKDMSWNKVIDRLLG